MVSCRRSLGMLLTAAIFAVLTTFNMSALADPVADKPEQHVRSGSDSSIESELTALAPMVGVWELTERHFDESGAQVGTVKGSEEIDFVLNKRAIRRQYSSGSDGGGFKAFGMLTFNATVKRFEGYWMDTAALNGPVAVSAEWNPATKTLVSSLTTASPGSDGVEFKVTDRLVDDEHRAATTYEIKKGKTIKRMEVDYVRSVRCPSRQAGLRIVPDMKVVPPATDEKKP